MKLALLRNVAPPQSDNKVADSGSFVIIQIEKYYPYSNYPALDLDY